MTEVWSKAIASPFWFCVITSKRYKYIWLKSDYRPWLVLCDYKQDIYYNMWLRCDWRPLQARQGFSLQRVFANQWQKSLFRSLHSAAMISRQGEGMCRWPWKIGLALWTGRPECVCTLHKHIFVLHFSVFLVLKCSTGRCRQCTVRPEYVRTSTFLSYIFLLSEFWNVAQGVRTSTISQNAFLIAPNPSLCTAASYINGFYCITWYLILSNCHCTALNCVEHMNLLFHCTVGLKMLSLKNFHFKK